MSRLNVTAAAGADLSLSFEELVRGLVPVGPTTPTRYTIEVSSGDHLTVTGTGFVYGSNGVVSEGLITGILRSNSGAPIFELTGAALPVSFLDSLIPLLAAVEMLSGPDTLAGGAGPDRLFGGAGNDSLSGGAGDDQLSSADGDDIFSGGSGNDTIEDAGAGSNYLRGDEGNDSLRGGTAFDDINGNMGDDSASGGDGDDWVVGGKDNDFLYGDLVDPLGLFFGGADIVYGNLGDDTCDGGGGDDIVRGGQGNDVLFGRKGNDFLSGDRGDDTIEGGLGADIFNTFGEAGRDVVLDFDAASGDRVALDPGTTFTVAQVGADTMITMTGGGQMILVGVSLSGLPAGWIIGG